MPAKTRKSIEASSASPTSQTPKGTRPSSRIKPSVEVVEVSSDNDDEETYKAGPQRGLSRVNRLDESSSQRSVEQVDDEDAVKKSRHVTRGSRHGRADNRICYNMKYHPMDEVTRPGRAAQVFSESAAHFGADDGGTSDVSLPSSAKGSDEESSEDEDEVEEVPERTQHPLATRHSARSHKHVNYSRKHHPQDHALPGYQHKARLLNQRRRKRKGTSRRATLEVQESDQEDDADDVAQASDREDEQLPQQLEEEDAEEKEIEADEPTRPRKKLRTLPDDRSSSPQKSARKRRSTKSSKRNAAAQESDSVQATGEEDAAGMNVDGNLFSGADQQASSSDNAEAALNLTGVVAGADVSSSSRTVTRQCGIGDDMFAGEDDEVAASVDDEPEETHLDPAEGSGVQILSEDEEEDEEDDEDDDKPSNQPGADQGDVRQEEDDGFFMNDDGPETPFEPVVSLQDIAKGARTAASNKLSSQIATDCDMSDRAEEHVRPKEGNVTTLTRAMSPARANMTPPGVTARTNMQSTEAAMHALVSTAAYATSSKPGQEQTFAGTVTVQKTATRTASSSSTLKADTRKASSSSTLKASTAKKSSPAAAETVDRHESQEESTGLLSDLGEHLTATMRSTIESDRESNQDGLSEEDTARGFDQQQLDGTSDSSDDHDGQSKPTPESGQNQSLGARTKAVVAWQTKEPLHPPRLNQASTQPPPLQCVSPADSFQNGQASKPVTPVVPSKGLDISVSADGKTRRAPQSQPPANRAHLHQQSPHRTPRPLLPNMRAPSQRSKGDVMVESDPDISPMKSDCEPMSPPSARGSSPSQYLSIFD